MKIAVLGAGLGGLAAARLLADYGHDVTVFERFEHKKSIGAGLLLQPPGQAVLAEMGLLAPLMDVSAPVKTLKAFDKGGKNLLDIEYSPPLAGHKGQPFGLGVHRPVLHDLLFEAAHQAGVHFQFSAEVTQICAHVDTVDLHFKNNPSCSVDYVVVGSGAHSSWLENTAVHRIARPYQWGCLWAHVPWQADCLSPDTLHQRCEGTHHMMGLMPTLAQNGTPTQAALYWSIHLDSFAAELSEHGQDTTFDRHIRSMKELWPEAAPFLAGLRRQDFSIGRYYDVWCARPVQGRVALIGDAAHGTSPQLGQGVTMALLDAVVLADALGAATRLSGPVFSRVARIFRHRRQMHQRYVRVASKMLTPLFQGQSSLLLKARDHVLAPVHRVFPFK